MTPYLAVGLPEPEYQKRSEKWPTALPVSCTLNSLTREFLLPQDRAALYDERGGPGGGTAGALWTMTPDGRRVLVVPAHRAYAAAMTEDDPFTAEESERLKAALREKDGRIRHAVQYGPGETLLSSPATWP